MTIRKQKDYTPTQSYLDGIGIAESIITASIRGKVKVFGIWWSALSIEGVTIQPGQQIHVVKRKGLILIVEPA